MAKAAWCVVAPTTGTGDKSIAISAAVHTGRTARSTKVTVQNQNGTKPSKEITVSQAPKALFLVKTSGPTPYSVPATGGVVAIIGKSNAKVITIDDDESLLSVTEFKVNGVLQTISSGDAGSPIYIIASDPGASAEYTFEVKLSIPANTAAYTRYSSPLITGFLESAGSGSPAGISESIKQAGATSTLTTDGDSISLVNAGIAQNVIITSNDSWIIS